MFAKRLNGRIVGLFANPQLGYAEEEISDSDPDVIAFLKPQPTKQQRKDEILKAVSCVSDGHLAKDIFVAEGFAQIAGQTTAQAYTSNVAYRALIDARNAIAAIEAEP